MKLLDKNYNLKELIAKIGIRLIFAFLCFIIQTSVFPIMPLLASSPNLLLIITFTYGLLYGEYVGLITGIICGVLYDMYYDGTFGVYILIYTLIGYFNGLLYTSFKGDTISIPMLQSIINTFIYNTYIYMIRFATRGRVDIFYYLFFIIVPNILINLLFTILFSRLIYHMDSLLNKIKW